MKSFLEYLLEAKQQIDTSILNTILHDTKYEFEIVPVVTNGKPSSTRFKVLVDKEHSSHAQRANIMQYLAQTYGGSLIGHAQDPLGVSFDEYGIKIVVKPKSKQGNMSDGVDSEYAIVNKINSLIAQNDNQPINIVFKSMSSTGTKKLICQQIVYAEQCGKDASNKKRKIKADIRLVSSSKVYNISLKKKGAAWVENGSVYGHDWYVPTIEHAISTHDINMLGNDQTGYKLSRTIYWDMTDDEKYSGLFGDDILPGGAVIEATFDDKTEINQIDLSTYEIPVLYIITSLNDVKGTHDLAWFAVNHHNRPGHWRGIYIRAAFMSRANANVKKVDRIDNVI